jgi:hypothetical protein
MEADDHSTTAIKLGAALLKVQNPNGSVGPTYLYQGRLLMRNKGLFNVKPGALHDFDREAITVTMPITIL